VKTVSGLQTRDFGGCTTVVKTLSRAFPSLTLQAGCKELAVLCGAILFVLLLLATYGLDLSPGFF
jgi:hypothetical protein